MPSRNLFESNEPKPDITEEDLDVADGEVFAILPPLKENQKYEVQQVGGETAVVVTEVAVREKRPCGCSKYQGCSTCGRYKDKASLAADEERAKRHET